MRVLGRSIRSLLEATDIEQKIEVDRLLKEFNAKSSQEISESEDLQQNLSSFVSLQKAFEKFFNQKKAGKQPFFVTTSGIKLNTEEFSKDHTFQYVSILRTIEVLLSKEDVQKYVLLSSKTENDGLICEFKDGLIYNNNPL